MLPDLDSLALFVRAAELRSLTKAADASHIGLAAASRRISFLERRFNGPLFERSPRGVELTVAGITLLPHAKNLLIQMNQMQAEMADHARGRAGVLRILANTSSMTDSLPGDLAAFAQLNPELRLIVEERWSLDAVRGVLDGSGDVGIVMEGSSTEGLNAYPYRSDRLAVVAPATHSLMSHEPLTFLKVLEHDLIALEDTSSMMRLLKEQAMLVESALRLHAQVRSFEAVCRMVQSGIGIGILPRQAAVALSQGMNLGVRELDEPWAERRTIICIKQNRATNASLSRLVAFLRAGRSQPPLDVFATPAPRSR